MADPDTPRHLTSWDDFDTLVSDSYAGMTNGAYYYPPIPWFFAVHGGFFTFDDTGDLAGATNLFAPSVVLDVPTWHVSVIETQLTERAWIMRGRDGMDFRTNAVPASFDPQAWVRDGYGQPPAHLAGAELARWYAWRDRSRLRLGLTLIVSNDWPALKAAFIAAATNPPAPANPPPRPPADSNRLAFAGIESTGSNANIRLWLFTPLNEQVDFFNRTNLTAITNQWQVMGTLDATAPFDAWERSAADSPIRFFHAARAGVDTDEDGLSDGRELLVYGTNPEEADSDGDGFSDRDELLNLGTDPLNPDITPPIVTITTPAAGSWEVLLP